MKRFSALAAVLVFAAACDSTVQQPLHLEQPVEAGPKLSTDYIDGMFDPVRLHVLWEVDGIRDGRLESVQGVSFNNNWLKVDLTHFSEYVMASN